MKITTDQLKAYMEIIEDVNYHISGKKRIYPGTRMICTVFDSSRMVINYHLNKLEKKYNKSYRTPPIK